jgi:cytoskeleton protein RodZ
MKMRTVGEVLQAERLSRKVSLVDLAAQSRIKVDLLKALEANNFAALPAAVFVKGYIRAYARLLGFDYRPVTALLRRDFKESARGQLVPREFVKTSLRRGRWLTPMRFVAVSLALSLVIIFGYVAWQWRAVSLPPMLVITTPVESAVVAARVEVKGLTQPDNIVVVNDEPVAIRPDGSFVTEVILPTEGLATLKVSATDRKGKQTTKDRTVMVKF